MANVTSRNINPGFEIQTPKYQDRQISTTNPVEKCNKIYMQKGTFWGGHQDVLHPMAEYSSTPQGVLEYPWSTPCGYPLSGNTWATTRVGDRHSAIRAPRSGRILLRHDPIFELVDTVVNEVRKRAFSARRLIWSAGGRDAASAKNGKVCALRY